jgi:hypothetical protein
MKVRLSIESIEVTQQAIQHAEDGQEKRSPGWKDQAYAYLKTFAQFSPEFTAEDVRHAADDVVPAAKEPRAWGGIFQRASREGLIKTVNYVPMKAAHSHRKPTPLWQSQIFNL